MMRLFQLWLADIRAKREYEELYNDARDDAAHWRGECRRLAELAVRHHKKRLLRDLEELEAEAERILKELEETK